MWKEVQLVIGNTRYLNMLLSGNHLVMANSNSVLKQTHSYLICGNTDIVILMQCMYPVMKAFWMVLTQYTNILHFYLCSINISNEIIFQVVSTWKIKW
jgi:hypothetical protein